MTEKKSDKDVSININCYTIRFRKKNEKDNLDIQTAFGGKKFEDIVQGFITSIDTKTFLNASEDRILYLEKSITFNSSIYTGIIRKGYSGQETYVDEMKSNKASTVGKIKTDQFNSSPFYFLLSLPASKSKCFLFLAQSYKQFGFKELFEDAFKKFFKTNYGNDIICEIGTLSIASLFEKYVNDGNIRKLRFKKHILTKNMENILGEEDDKDRGNYEMELSVLAKGQGFLGIKKSITLDNTSFIETFKLKDFEYDEAFADVSFGGRKRVLNITRPESFSASYDVTDKTLLDKDTNHPDFVKLNEEVMSILKDEILPHIKL
jgi:hypothetical protein